MVETPEAGKWSGYRATAGREAGHPCLTTSWVLGQFGGKKAAAEKAYREFVGKGIGKTIWDEVRPQAILGKEAFADTLVDHLKKHRDVPEIARSQGFAQRPALEKLFLPAVLGDRRKRDRKIAEAVEQYGYTQRAIAHHLETHYSDISQILSGWERYKQ